MPVEFDEAAEHARVAAKIAESPFRLASYRSDNGDFVLLRLNSDLPDAADAGDAPATRADGASATAMVVGRRIRQASLVDRDHSLGLAAENAALEAAQNWGLPDFVFPPGARCKGSGVRELGDGTILSGTKGLALQVKAREAQPTDTGREGRWLAKKAQQAAKQGAGTIRTYLNQPCLAFANMRGRRVKVDGTQVT